MEQITLQEYMDIKQEIRNSMTKAVVSFVEIGYNLKKIRDGELYQQDGYKDIWEAAEAEFGLKRKQAWAFMNINDRYSVDGNSMELLPQYQGFSKSTLTEMLTLPEEDYELITKDTKIEDIRELKQAEKEYEQKEEQLEGQQSLIDNYKDVVPDQDKPEEADLMDVLRKLFHPKDMERYLNRLLDGEDIKIWTQDFYQNVEHTFSRMPYFIFFYEYSDGFKIKNIKTQQIESHTYNDLWLLATKAFMAELDHKEEHGGQVWDIAFGDEWREQQRIEKEKEKKLKEAEKKKKEKEKAKKAESLDSIPTESDFEEPEKVPETTEIRSEESENELEQPKEESKTPENEHDENAEKPDFTLTETNSEIDDKSEVVEGDVEDENMPSCATCEESPFKSGNGEKCGHCALNPIEDESMCDIAQFTIILPVLPGDHIYSIYPAELDEEQKPVYATYQTFVYMYEYRSRKTIEMRYYDNKNNSRSCTIPVDGTYQQIMNDNRLFITREEAEERCAELNGES